MVVPRPIGRSRGGDALPAGPVTSGTASDPGPEVTLTTTGLHSVPEPTSPSLEQVLQLNFSF